MSLAAKKTRNNNSFKVLFLSSLTLRSEGQIKKCKLISSHGNLACITIDRTCSARMRRLLFASIEPPNERAQSTAQCKKCIIIINQSNVFEYSIHELAYWIEHILCVCVFLELFRCFFSLSSYLACVQICPVAPCAREGFVTPLMCCLFVAVTAFFGRLLSPLVNYNFYRVSPWSFSPRRPLAIFRWSFF